MSFRDFGLSADLLRGVEEMGYTQPTPIQTQAIPPVLAGRDVMACAMTGSGKTAAFVLPILERLAARPTTDRGVRVLVLAPTRELAAQIHEHFTQLGAHAPFKAAAIFGGVAIGPQERAWRQGVEVLIATPGRLLDHLQYPYAKLDKVEVLVLDEADRMLDMGFLPDIKRVLGYLPAERQNLLFSATLPPPIVALAREMLHDPAAIGVERKAAPATGVTQAVYPVREDLKAWLLAELLRRGEIKNVLVFTRTKHRANRLADFLTRHGIACDRIHGNRSQAQRTMALAAFKDGKTRVLVATDIAARGIDVEALSHVINFDVPNVPEDYIHRVGRTARAEALGDAFTFASPDEQSELAAIERAVGRRLPRLALAGFDYEHKPNERLEIPIAERIAAIRARKSEERARAREKAERKREAGGGNPPPQGQRPASGPRSAQGPRQPQGQHQGQGQRQGQGGPRRGAAAHPGRPAGDRFRGKDRPRTAARHAALPTIMRPVDPPGPRRAPSPLPDDSMLEHQPPPDHTEPVAPGGFNRRPASWRSRAR